MKESVKIFFPEKNFWNGYFIILENNKIHLHNKEKNLIKIIDLENSIIDTMINKKKELQITLKNKKSFKIYSSQKPAWIKALKSSNLHPYRKNLLKNCKSFQKYKIQKPTIRYSIPISYNTKMNIWQIIRQNIGKILTKITVPITFNEPLTFLQRSVERLQYINLLKKANNSSNQYERISLIFLAFIFIYGNIPNRVRKPFNPLLGETFEFISNKFRFISEQVSHHPPIHCGFCDSDDFTVNYCFYPNPSLGINLVKVSMLETDNIRLKKTGEEFLVYSPEIKVTGILQGNYMPIVMGEYKVVNKMTGDVAKFKFDKSDLKNKDYFRVKGVVLNKDKQVLYDIEGFYNGEIKVVSRNYEKNVLVRERINENLKNFDKMYYLSKFGINLNNLYEELVYSLPPTDSRFRPDLRAYENGDLKLGSEEKIRLENNQRKRKNQVFKPQWFFFERNGKKIKFEFKGNYWKCRESGKWPSDMVDIFND